MHAEAGLIGIDIDKCVSPDGSVAPWALAIAQSFTGTYWERSSAGRASVGSVAGLCPWRGAKRRR